MGTPTRLAPEPDDYELVDLDSLLATVERYEQLPLLTEAEFGAYLEAESNLEQILLSESEASAAQFDFDRCDYLVQQVIALNETLPREVAPWRTAVAGTSTSPDRQILAPWATTTPSPLADNSSRSVLPTSPSSPTNWGN